VLRGAGASLTRLTKTSSTANPLILIGERWLKEAESVDLTADAPKGATSAQVTSAAGFSVGQLVLVDEITDESYVYWGTNAAVAPGGPGRGWFTRYDRPVGQMLEIASISGNAVSFTTPLHIGFDTAHRAQLTRYTIPYGAKYAGLEDLYVRGGQDDNITVRFAMYSWVKGVESDWSMGDSFALDSCFRCVLRDSYAHDTPNPYPGGAGYMLSLATYTADSLVENSIFINGNKVMVMRASGGGNVIGYNYFDNGHIGNDLGWMETGLNASHLTCPHFELFEGNQAFNIDGDDTWGGAVYNTFFRNHATGKRRSYADINSRRAIGLMYGHYWYSFVGNVLGTPDQHPRPLPWIRLRGPVSLGERSDRAVEARIHAPGLECASRCPGGQHRAPACQLRLRHELGALGQRVRSSAAKLALPCGQARLLRRQSLALGGRLPDPSSSIPSRPGPDTTRGRP
jgi:hypothetical protein